MRRFNFGDSVKDEVSGLKGIITGFLEYMGGSIEWLVQPPVKEDGSYQEPVWVREDRLEIVEQ